MLRSRESETAAIDRLIEAAAASRGGGLVLSGDPGTGKSALLEHGRLQAGAMRVLSATATPAEADFAYATLHQLLRPVLGGGWRDGLPAPQGHALAVALGIESGDAPDRFLVSLAALTLLSELGGERPVVVLVDDAHWADSPSLDVLVFLARRLASDPVAVLAAVRTGESGLEGAGLPVLEIGDLDPDAAAALLDERWGDAIAAPVRDAILGAAGGNPLALIELPRALSPEQLAGRDPLPDPLPLARTLERVFAAWLDPLAADARTVALLCAAEGSGSLATIAGAALRMGVSEPVARIEELATALVVEGPAVAFRHPLIRSAIYQAAAPAARRDAHRALAAVLDDEDRDPDRAAWHRAHAAVGPDAAVADLLERSAERALARAGALAAARALEQAAALSPMERDRTRRLVAAAEAAWLGGDTPRARMLLERAGRPEAMERATRLAVAHLAGSVELRSGTPEASLAVLVPAAREALATDPGLAFRMIATAGEAAFQAADPDAMRELGRLMEALRPDDPRHVLLRQLYLSVNSLPERPLTESPELAGIEELDDPDLLTRAAGMTFGRGDHALSLRLRTKAVARARALGAAGTLARALRALVLDELSRGRYAWAEAGAAEGYRVALETGQPNLACQHQALLAELAGLRGRADESRRLGDDVLAQASGRGLHGAAAFARRALAGVALAAGRPEEALEQLEALWALGRPVARGLAVPSTPDLVEAAVRAGRAEAGASRLPLLVAWASAVGTPEARALACRAGALLATGERAEALFREALEASAAAPERPFDRARTTLLYGEHLRRERRRVDAREPLRQALAAFETLGTPAWAERARAELRATGETARRRDPSTLDQLTQQELQVVRTVSQGVSNREAAAQLFISPRTVDHHLRSVFRKLGISSRAEMIRLVAAGDVDAG